MAKISRHIAPAPSFADGIEAAIAEVLPWTSEDHAQLHAGEMTAQERRSVKAVVGAIVASLRALAHNPQASSEYEKCATCNGTGLHLNMAGEPDECLDCKGNTVVPAERSDAVAELVERLREDAEYLDNYFGFVGNQYRIVRNISDLIAALTASNDRVAELERERDEALATMTRATEAMVECGNLLADEELKREAAEAEVSRLKAGAVTDGWRPIESAPKDGSWIELWRPLPIEDGPYFEPLIIARWYTFDDGDEAWAWPDDVFEVWTPHGRQRAEEMMSAGDCYEDTKSFTHWRPLSAPPLSLSNQAGASK